MAAHDAVESMPTFRGIRITTEHSRRIVPSASTMQMAVVSSETSSAAKRSRSVIGDLLGHGRSSIGRVDPNDRISGNLALSGGS